MKKIIWQPHDSLSDMRAFCLEHRELLKQLYLIWKFPLPMSATSEERNHVYELMVQNKFFTRRTVNMGFVNRRSRIQVWVAKGSIINIQFGDRQRESQIEHEWKEVLFNEEVSPAGNDQPND